MKKRYGVFQFLLMSLSLVIFTACGKQKANTGNNGALGAQPPVTYSLQEVTRDFEEFEFAIDDLYSVGIEAIFDANNNITGFVYYVGDRDTQVSYINTALASAEVLLTKYSRPYYVQSGSTTYLAQLQANRAIELQVVKRELARIASAILSGALKPQPGQVKSKPRMKNRTLDDWQQAASKTSKATKIKGDDGGTDPATGGKPKPRKVTYNKVIAASDGGTGIDPAIGLRSKSSPEMALVALQKKGDGDDTDPATGGLRPETNL